MVKERNELIVCSRRRPIDRDTEVRLTDRFGISCELKVVVRTFEEEVSVGIDMSCHELSFFSREVERECMAAVSGKVEIEITEVLVVSKHAVEVQRITFVVREVNIREDDRRRVHKD